MTFIRSTTVSISFFVVLACVLLATKDDVAEILYRRLLFTYVPRVVDDKHAISYTGHYENEIEHFQNIFYAEDTSGPDRFAPPVPLEHPPGTVIDATTMGAFCPQGVGGPPLPFQSPITNISENCLSLRVARYRGTTSKAKLPVLVWIHGGGNTLGSAADEMFNPNGLVQQAKANGRHIVFVGVNYRLGIYGYAASKALIDRRHANNGLRDQRAAFEWVRRNIAAFGGDPDNVTAMGQSVGASSIGLHLTSYRGQRGVPFHKAIILSGATGTNFNIMSPLMATNTANVAKSLNCIPENSTSDSEETLLCLKNASMEAINKFAISYPEDSIPRIGGPYFNPSYDGDYIPERPYISLSKGDFVKDIPLLLTSTTNDGAWFAPPNLPNPSSALKTLLNPLPYLSPSSIKKLEILYPETEFSHLATQNVTASYHVAAQVNRDVWFTCPVLDFAQKYHSRHAAGQGGNVFLAAINTTRHLPIWSSLGLSHWRAAHLSEVPYVFNTREIPGGDNSPEQLALSKKISSSIVNFAWNGTPSLDVSAGNSREGVGLGGWKEAFDNNEGRMGVMVVDGKGQSDGGMVWINNDGNDYMGSGNRDGDDIVQKQREEGLRWERLTERCAFISSIADEVGV